MDFKWYITSNIQFEKTRRWNIKKNKWKYLVCIFLNIYEVDELRSRLQTSTARDIFSDFVILFRFHKVPKIIQCGNITFVFLRSKRKKYKKLYNISFIWLHLKIISESLSTIKKTQFRRNLTTHNNMFWAKSIFG